MINAISFAIPFVFFLMMLILYYLVFIKESKSLFFVIILFFSCGVVISSAITYPLPYGPVPSEMEKIYSESSEKITNHLDKYKNGKGKEQNLKAIYTILDDLRQRSGNRLISKINIYYFLGLIEEGKYDSFDELLRFNYKAYIENIKKQIDGMPASERLHFFAVKYLNLLFGIFIVLSLVYKSVRLRGRTYILEA